jgi:hypothetical protein
MRSSMRTDKILVEDRAEDGCWKIGKLKLQNWRFMITRLGRIACSLLDFQIVGMYRELRNTCNFESFFSHKLKLASNYINAH